MSLYHNITHWDYNLELGEGEHVAFVRYPFSEYVVDPVFKVLTIYEGFYADLEVVYSTFMTVGTVLERQSLRDFRRVKLTPIKEDLTYNKSV